LWREPYFDDKSLTRADPALPDPGCFQHPGGGREPTLLGYPGGAMDVYLKVFVLHIP
jgi:hypothetical protein